MPKVGEKHFAYTAKGKKAAMQHAKKTGQAVEAAGELSARKLTAHGRKKSKAKRAY